MSSRPDLKIDWCTHEAAVFACKHWHYSRTLPVGKLVKIGVWEDGRFIGVVLFAWGMNRNLVSPYGLQLTEGCELVRVALAKHKTPVTRILRISLKMLRQQSPGLRLIVSFADSVEGHHGGIYQGGNWVYAGKSPPGFEWVLNGKRLNKRAYTGQQFGKGKASVATIPAGAVKRSLPGKHRYLMPLDEAMREQIEPLRKPYPKRVRSVDSDTSGDQPEVGGANPTRTLSDSVASQRGDK
jgi:hypothetical protein